MKTKLLIFSVAAFTFIFTSCKKNDSGNTTTTTNSYINTTAGSTWNYHQVDSSGSTPAASDYTVTSTSQDTTINSKKYHVYNLSDGGNQYMTVSGNDYYQYDSIPVSGGTNIERLYLKDNATVGTTWNQSFTLNVPNVPLPIPLTVTNNIIEKGISHTVNGVSYSNVIHVSTSLSSALITSGFTSSIDSYYAPKYGLIESKTVISLDYLGLTENVNMSTQLMSASLK
jgi:hypothetical protein